MNEELKKFNKLCTVFAKEHSKKNPLLALYTYESVGWTEESAARGIVYLRFVPKKKYNKETALRIPIKASRQMVIRLENIYKMQLAILCDKLVGG